ncbi:MAG TPA: Pycsar system effector family protein [Puia sp.]|nr:Pycsar system effector family protein [Puia sp.]
MSYPESLTKLSARAIQLYVDKADDRLFYHNLAHTGRLLESVNRMNDHFKLDDKNYFIACATLWLYNLEHISSDNSEMKSTTLSDFLLDSLELNDDEKEEIKNCILATKGLRQPVTLNEKIVCDAVSFYLGSPYFSEYNKLRRKEAEAISSEKIKGAVWRSRTVSLLQNHQFQTSFCQDLLDKTKEENLKALTILHGEKHLNKHLHFDTHLPNNNFIDPPGSRHNQHIVHPPGWKYKSKHHLSGVETVFRNSSSNHLNLSVMADNKAFIMISVNSILISLGIGLIIGKFVLIPKLFIPTVLLLFVNVFTIIYSVLATRPGLMKGKFTMEDVQNKKVDLLFFGNFFKMPLVDFEYGMKQMMDDSDFLYDNLIRDIYAQGQILGRKFRLLRSSYNIFMYGTASVVVAYIISFFL